MSYKNIYTSIKNPRWVNKENTAIDCEVKFECFKDFVPFTASPHDTEEHGREIFRRCRQGDFGDVAAFKPQSQKPFTPTQVTIFQDEFSKAAMSDFEDFLQNANYENSKSSPRGIVLIWASFLEDLLGRLLEAFLIEHKKSREMIWKNFNGPLSTFNNRSQMCFALGLITKQELSRLDEIRKVRNELAHQWNSTNDAEVAQKITLQLENLYKADHSSLYEWRDDYDLVFLVRHFYSSSCLTLAISFRSRLPELQAERREQRKS